MVILYSVNKISSLKEEVPIGDYLFRATSEFTGAINFTVTAWIVKNIKIEKCLKLPNRLIETSPHCLLKVANVMNSNIDMLELETGPFFIAHKNKQVADEDIPLCTVDYYGNEISKRLVIYTPVFNPNLLLYKL